MGDASDMAELGRLMRSEEGRAYLENIAARLRGRTIMNVDFTNQSASIAMTLELDNGAHIGLELPELDIGVLREQFNDVMEREYYKDYPERGRDFEP